MTEKSLPSVGVSRLAAALNAQSIAVVGASAEPGKITGRPLAYMLERGYRGKLYPVNPRRPEVQGMRGYPSIASIGEPVDLAIVGTEAEKVEAIVEEGIAAGIRAFVIFSSGFAEMGAEGRALQDRLSALARKHDVAIIGPNCLGVVNSSTGLIASFTTALESAPLKQGGCALVSQSGALGAYWLDMMLRAGLGFSQWVCTGNECDVDVAETLDYLVDDPDTRVICLYIEEIRNVEAFRAALRRAAMAGKPVIAIKSGRSQAGARAAASHTGALAGDDALYDACLRQGGALRVNSLSEMIGIARMYLRQVAPKGTRLAVMSVSGGAGVMIADEGECLGLEVPPFAADTCQRLEAVLPSFAHAANPLDLTGQVVQNTPLISQALEAVGSDPNVDAIVIFVGLMHSIAGAFTDALASVQKRIDKPIAVIWMGAMAETVQTLEEAGLAVFTDIPQAMKVMSGVAQLNALRESALMLPDRRPARSTAQAGRQLTEWSGKQLFAEQQAIDVPSGVLLPVDARPEHLPSTLSYPVVAKLQAPTLLHKTDAGGVVLRITSDHALREACAKLHDVGQRVDGPSQGILIEEMVTFDYELLLGLRRDMRFGPVMTIARGGIEVELDPDVATCLLPLNASQVENMLRGLRAARLFEGFRGRAPVDLPAISKKIAELAEWFCSRPDLLEVEINPLAVKGARIWALDALVTQVPE